MTTGPSAEYRLRLARRRAARDRLSQADARLSYGRLALFAAAVVLAALAWQQAVTPWALLLPVLAFLVLMQRHDRVIRGRDAAERAIAFYERGLARIEDRWSGSGEPGDRFRDDGHLYANDLDLFGRGSLFELLSTARTRDGEATLAGWLLAPADAEVIGARQEAVAELARALDLRERLAVSGQAHLTMDSSALAAWAETPEPAAYGRLRRTATVFSVIVAAAIGYLVVTSAIAPLIAVLILEALVFRSIQDRVERTLHVAGNRVGDLDVLADLLTCLEGATFEADRLVALHRTLYADDERASSVIRRLHRLSEFHDWQHSLPLLPIALFLAGYLGPALSVAAVLMLWDPLLVVAIERWRRRHGARVRAWVATVAEFEALASLAAYRYEHPADPFPEIVSGERGLFDGAGLGHPLLPSEQMIRNDVRLDGATRLLVVSGSNMSGKSTLLRTIGVNAVLALAGAPVRATSLRLTPMAIGATLRIQDSLQEGRSRFYAEITRIRALAERASGPIPLLFLLDELFHGTNSHDRLVGAAGVLRSLLDNGAIGLITTHDLALTTVADELSPRAANVHFEDWFEGGEMRFDYRAKHGPVTRSNAIALMRAVGLEVEPQ